jgi:hypothetical protein
MATQRKQLTLREQIFDQRVKIWDLYCKSRVLEAFEKTKDSDFRDIYNTYDHSFRLWGGVEFVFWLQALVKKCKSYNSNLEPIAIFSLPKRGDGDKTKITMLKVIAKQMGLDVEITSRRALKPARPVKPPKPKYKRGTATKLN